MPVPVKVGQVPVAALVSPAATWAASGKERVGLTSAMLRPGEAYIAASRPASTLA